MEFLAAFSSLLRFDEDRNTTHRAQWDRTPRLACFLVILHDVGGRGVEIHIPESRGFFLSMMTSLVLGESFTVECMVCYDVCDGGTRGTDESNERRRWRR